MTNPDNKALNLLTLCMEQGRITEAGFGVLLPTAVTHYDNIVATLAKEYPSATEEGPDSRKWSFNKLKREAPAQLEAMQRDEPDRFEALKNLYVAELKNPKSAAGGKGFTFDKDGKPVRKSSLPIGPARLATAQQRPARSEFERMSREEPTALGKMRKEEPDRYERLKQEHVEKLTKSK